MPDPKGFLNIPPEPWARRPVDERVQDWQQVYEPGALLPIISDQAGRCMDCGIPFCHDGCPLGNLIPEWNDLVWRDDWRDASERLHSTNNFPEFTGLLCPAPCESACVLAINKPAVTIKNIEIAIALEAWDRGLVHPQPPDRHSGKTVAVVGSGPAGLAAAQQLTRAGHTVVVYEKDDRLGGLLRYGIPEFKMEKHHIDRRIKQMRAEGTKFRTSVCIGDDINARDLRDRYDAVVLAIGATNPRELDIPGRHLHGFHLAMDYLRQANRVQEGDIDKPGITAEGKHVVIVGGGDTGADCLGTVLRQGAASVTQLDINPLPGVDRPEGEPWPVYPKIYRVAPAYEEARELNQSDPGADIRTFSASTFRADADDDGNVRVLHTVDVESEHRRPVPGTERELRADLVLLALGFTGPDGDGPIAQLELETDPRTNIARDEAFTTSTPGVFVAGDAGRGQSLIVWAIAEGRAAAAAVDESLMGSSTLPAPIKPSDRPLTA